MKKNFAILAIFALVLAGCGDGGEENESTSKTTLTINNMSSYNLLDVEYASIDFGTINNGKDATKDVKSGTRYLFFYLLISSRKIRCRTDQSLTCDESKNNEFTITNNTLVTTTVDDRTDSLKNQVDAQTNDYQIGDEGPGGGMIFYAQGGQYKECSEELGSSDWIAAMTTAQNYKGGDFTDWHLPDRGEVNLIYMNLYRNGLGVFILASGLNTVTYWTSDQYNSTNAYFQRFSDGGQDYQLKTASFRVRAVRTFTN